MANLVVISLSREDQRQQYYIGKQKMKFGYFVENPSKTKGVYDLSG